MTYDPVETISIKNTTTLTQVERIVVHILSHPERIWWFAGDFMQPRLSNEHPHYVGYEASARLTDALSMFNQPEAELFETKKDGKFRMVAINWREFENCLKVYPRLIKLAELTDIMSRFDGLKDRVNEYKPKEKKKVTFKSYG